MKRLIPGLLIAVATLIALPLLWPTRKPDSYQGWIEANLRFIGAETTARLVTSPIAEGQTVKKGETLFRLKDDLATANIENARAQLASAEAQLALAEAAQKRPEEIEILQATRRETKAQLDLARQELERVRTLAAKGTAPKSSLDSAVASEVASKAALDSIDGQIALAIMPARDEEIGQAMAAVESARAGLAEAERTRDRLTVIAPSAGRVQQRYYEEGEIVPAGRPVVSLLTPRDIRIRFFVPEAEIARFRAGQSLTVDCDGCTPIEAKVSFIAQEAEYTPPEIYSLEERAKLVYRIDAIPVDPQILRPGLPVDVLAPTGETR